MAFGESLKKKAQQANTQDNDNLAVSWPFVNLKEGVRIIRLLPVMQNGVLVYEQAKDSLGKSIKGKKTLITETEVTWLEAFWPVMVDGEEQKRRIMLDPAKQFKNPLWEYIAARYEKGSQERKVLKRKFGINVIDLTPVLFNDKGVVIYPNLQNEYVTPALGKKIETPLKGIPEPLNQVRIFEGSHGDEGGRHLFQSLSDAVFNVVDDDGNTKLPHEFSLRVTTRGTGQFDTTRDIRMISGYKPLPESLLTLPRYDIETWSKPWPDEAVEALLEGEDFNDVIEKYGIITMPQLVKHEEETKEESLFD